MIRGSSSTGDFFLDGMRDDVQYYRDLYNIQQVEVLKGPNGMLFGRGGVGGLINRVTKQPDGTRSAIWPCRAVPTATSGWRRRWPEPERRRRIAFQRDVRGHGQLS